MVVDSWPSSLEARKIADTMQEKKMKEVGMFRNRLTLLEHIETLIHKDILKQDTNVLKAAIHATTSANVDLPYDIRLAIAERYAVDCMRQMQNEEYEAKKFEKLALEWLDVVAVWKKPEGSVNERNLTFRWVLDVQLDQLDYQVRFKGLAAEERNQKLEEDLEDIG